MFISGDTVVVVVVEVVGLVPWNVSMELMEPSSVKRLLDNVRFVIDSLLDVVVSKGVIVVFMMLIFSVGKTILLLVLVSVSASSYK